MNSFLADLKHGFRVLVKHPGLTSIAVIALSLGIGLTSTMWSIVYGALLRGLPFPEAERIMHLEHSRPSHGIRETGVPPGDYAAWREQQKSFVDLAAYDEGTVNVTLVESHGQPERFEGGFVTPSVFPLLQVPPRLGRLFAEEDGRKGAPPVAMIGWDLWQNRFGGDPGIVGKTVRANGVTREIIGVMPRGFEFPTNAKLWLPLVVDPLAQPWGEGSALDVMGRLKPGVTLKQAKSELNTITARLTQDHPKENEGIAPVIKSFSEQYVGREPTIMLWTMMAAVFGVLLIACSNVANLLLARAATRTKEIAVRIALGASRARIVSQLLIESLALSLVGAVIGIGIAWVGVRAFANAIVDAEVPFWIVIKLDGSVILFTVGITLVAALVSGIIPALQATRTGVNAVLKDEGRGTSSLRLGKFSRGLVMAELALSGGLLVGAGFMIQSVVQRSRFDYGVPTAGVFTARVGLFESTYPDSGARARFWTTLDQQLQTLPDQHGAALMSVVPGIEGWRQLVALDGKTYANERDYPKTRRVAVTPEWFGTFGLKPLEGRLLGPGDIGGALPVAVVTHGFAQTHFGGESAVGRRIRIGGPDSKEPWLTIVGVVPDVWYDGSDDNPLRTVVITPLLQSDYRFISIAVASTGDPMRFNQPVQGIVSAIDPDQPTYFVRTLQEAIRLNGWFYGVFGTLFMVFGGAALFLAMVGVYGVMSFSVSRRTQEIGIRMALGAATPQVLGMFLRQGGRQALIGLSAGLVLAFLLAQGLVIVLFQVNTKSPVMYVVVTLALALTSLIATYIPARRATTVDPVVALRYE